tara:strand:+ start:4766 stop:4972 length:207 start_codon:yes stop_codon:yes gene_type:complete
LKKFFYFWKNKKGFDIPLSINKNKTNQIMEKLIEFLEFRVKALEKKINELEQTVKEQNNYILSETQNK